MHSGLNDLAVGLPHSEIPGSKLGYQLPWAFRRFLRPSSPLDAKTSTVCPFTLGHVNRIPSGRLASDRRSLTDAHAGPSCVWTSDLPHSPRRRVLQAASQANLDRCLPSNRANVMRAQPARLRDLSTIESHALFTEPEAFAPALPTGLGPKCRVEESNEVRQAVKGRIRQKTAGIPSGPAFAVGQRGP